MRKNNKTAIRILIIVISSIILGTGLYFGVNAYSDYLERQKQTQARDVYHEAVNRYNTPTPAPTATPTPTAAASPTAVPTPREKTIKPEFTALREHYDNDDIIGYLRIDGTTIDYPVTQSDDNSYYLDHDIYKNNSIAGWPFLDYENDIEKDDKNMIIYGHNMNADYMFHSLRFFVDEEYYKEHRFITFDTVYESYTWEIFSFYRTTTDFNYIQVIFNSDGEYKDLVEAMKKKSMYDTGVSVSENDRVLNLSTCTNTSDEERFVLSAKLVGYNTISY